MSAAHTSAPLTRTDIARLWRETTGGVQMSQTDEEFARRVERAAIEAVAADEVLDALKTIRTRLIECSKGPFYVSEAFDTFYQEVVDEAIAAAQGEQS